ncbi:LysR family transcriptional regulator [Porticoccaceae bacterium]|jgi:DNA-binding transcriptional LysR family regulator|nr:LysR family transcriptional regulator [Porticoccaceae bacterium]MBT4212938.1 LysR family transcriptional regulator [Porticoccaceae bacterium]MBT7947499.1 LysR family transcriptional regulator [Porticoccaceae bacterium]MDA7588713.1 LysR family transcriptional regulator [Porticoccaceae bacterium]MDC3200517.1 LysR family transcriptional regulator [Porticoccaceae bacterium]
MNLRKLSRLDLNLLVSLQALLEEKSVTRAAARLFISQPAMSRVLQRLRDQLDDPLFTRTGNELIPTPKARELQLRLPPLLDNILDIVSEGEFDPATYVGEITIAVPEFVAISLISELTRVLTDEARGIVLSVSSGIESVEGDLAEGALDFAIDIERGITDEINATPLAMYTPSIWMREGHPLATKDKMTLDEILTYSFVQYYLLISKRVSARNDARFDRALRGLGLKREKTLVTNQLMTAMETVCDTDCLMVATQKDLVTEREMHRIVSKAFPEELPHDESINLVLLQHQRTAESPIHFWLREKIIELVQEKDKVTS